MFNDRLIRYAIVSGMSGLALIVAVIVSGAAYPNPFFTYGTLIGLLLVFAANALLVTALIRNLAKGIKSRDILSAAVAAVAIFAIIIIYITR